MMTLHRQLNNESGVATLLMVIAGILIVGLVGMNFVIEQQNKHQGSAVTVNAEQAQANAEAGFRYATKCLQGDDPQCRCNTDVGANGCTNWLNMQNFTSVPLGLGNFLVTFSDLGQCSIAVTSTGIVNNTQRSVTEILTRNAIGGAVQAITVNNAVSFPGSIIPPIAVMNLQQEVDFGNGNNTVTEPNYAIPAGNNMVLVVLAGAIGSGGNKLPTGVTFGGTPMNLADQRQYGGGGRPGVAQYYLSVTAGQVGDIVVTYAGGNNNRTIVAVTLSNAVAPPENTENDRETDDDIRDNITTLTTNAMVISTAFANRENNAFAIGGGHIEITGNNFPNGENIEAAMGRVQAGAPGNVNNIGFDNNVNGTRWVMALASYPHANRTISGNYTVPAGNNQVLVVVAGAEDGIAPTLVNSTRPISATFNGLPMNLIDNERANSTSFEAGIGMFWLGVNAGDSGTITVTYNDSAIENKTLHAYTLNNTTGPQVDNNSALAFDGTTLTQTLTALLPAGSMVATGAYMGNNDPFTATPAGHSIASDESQPSSYGVMGSFPVPVAQVPPAMGYSTTDPLFNRMVLLLAAFTPAGGGGLCTASP